MSALFGLLSEYSRGFELGSPRDPNEVKMMQSVNTSFKKFSGKSGITVKVGNYVFDHIIGMNSNFPGDPKADVSLVSVIRGKPIETVFLSFKKAGGASAFQQYSGLTEKAGLVIYNDKIVKNFLVNAGKHIESFNKGKNTAMQGTPAFFQYVPNNKDGKLLVKRAIFGPDYKEITSKKGIGGNKQNVHVIAQGNPTLKKTGTIYELEFSDHVYSNNQDIRWAFTGDYSAVLAGTFRNGRGFEIGSKRYMNFRVGLYPAKLVVTRRGAVEF